MALQAGGVIITRVSAGSCPSVSASDREKLPTQWNKKQEGYGIEMRKSHRIYPECLYNALPYVYLCAGLVAAILLSNMIGVLSGLVLASAAGIVWMMRYRYRREFVQCEGHIDVPTEPDADDLPVDGLVQISWSKSLECGHPVIDGQHRRLFGLANEAINTLLTKQPKAAEEPLLEKLVAHMDDHFHTEELVLAEIKDPGFDGHREQHRALLAKAANLRERYHNGQVSSRELVTFLADEVISHHIVKEDLKVLSA